ncbi:hypothetical protein FX985_03138 [Pseudomonas extremaustralis]|uniref:Uncharacterized protein n=2 Tax=Pseudomonas extremaustralis TaxID=359110 RepID=A0A5M9J2L4_9PSED|nr:hypothetical protein FX985_03138 [Pseudomonas extremaustralis]
MLTAPTQVSAQANGDAELAGLLAHAQRSAISTGRLEDIDNIPPASSFGQWWSHLHNLMKSPHFVGWASRQGIDLSKNIEINPRGELIAAMVGGERKTFSSFAQGHLWTSIMAPIMQAAKALTSNSAYIHSPTSSTSAPYRAVADFYGEEINGQTKESLGARATTLEQTKAFDLTRSAPERSEEVLQDAKANLATAHDQENVAMSLIDIILDADELSADLIPRTKRDRLDRLYRSPWYAQTEIQRLIRDQLSRVSITLHADSPSRALQEGTTVSLEKYLSDNAWDIPKNRDELFNLGRLLTTHPLSQLPHANLGGALSWPMPLSDENRRDMREALSQNTLGIDDLQQYDEGKGVLGYLTRNQQFMPYELSDPTRIIQNLLATPKAWALGQALQEKFNGISTPQSIDDWALAALGATLDRESEAGNTSTPVRTGVAGFDLARQDHWGMQPSTIVAELTEHLIYTGRTSRDLAPIAAHLLLSRGAPAFLVKDIPEKVTYGSHSWVSFSTAVARLEAQAPGSTARMTYTQVMQRADMAPATEQDRQVERRAQRDALKDWGVANGVISVNLQDDYTDEQMSRVLSAFNAQISELSEASKAYATPMPDRKKLALEELKRVYGDQTPFEKKCITSNPQLRDYPGPYSMLDLYLQGNIDQPPGSNWTSSSDDVDTRTMAGNADQLADINKLFSTELPNYFSSAEKAVGAQVKNLIATLPLEDRKNIEYGKITTLQEYNVSQSAFSRNVTETKVPNSLLVKSESNRGAVNVYEIDIQKNTIRKRDELDNYPLEPQVGGDGHTRYSTMLKEIIPSGSYSSNITDEKNQTDTPNSFASEKTGYIADAMVKTIDIRQLAAEARGLTTFDTEVPFYKKARAFMLDLIPLRSAIKNFQAGNIGEGVTDLIFDAFGFAMGLGAAARGAKALQTGASVVNKLAQGVKIVGRAALGSLNPLSGLGDLAKGGAALVNRSVRHVMSEGAHAVNLLKGPTGSYNLLKRASKDHGVVATGTYKLAEQTIESGAVLSQGKWYAYNPINGRAYGPPLPMFSANSVAMGGDMQSFRVLDHGLGMSEDMTKRGLRLTLDAHGDIPTGWDSALMRVNGSDITPNELLDLLKASNVDLNKYTEIRLTMCHSGNGAEQSFAAQFSTLTNKPTEGFLGIMHTSAEVEDVAARMFKIGGAKQREYIENAVIGNKKTIDKYEITSQTPDGRNIYTHHKDYNPVRFDAQGKPMLPKPPLSSYSKDPVKLPETKNEDFNFSEYDDLT